MQFSMAQSADSTQQTKLCHPEEYIFLLNISNKNQAGGTIIEMLGIGLSSIVHATRRRALFILVDR